MEEYKHDEINLINWIKDNNGFIHSNLYINSKQIDNHIHRSIYYKNTIPIHSNSIFSKIPHNLTISIDTFNNIPNIDKWKNTVMYNDSKLQVIISLIYETIKKENSFHYPYIKLLPKYDTFVSHPISIYFNDNNSFKVIESISEKFIYKLKSKSNELTKYIEVILYNNKQFKILDTHKLKEMIIWAYFIYTTRAWHTKLVPFNDMFNHSNNSNISLSTKNLDKSTYHSFYASNQLSNQNNKPYEVFINYGSYNLLTLFISYNFIHNDKVDYIQVPYKLKSNAIFNIVKEKAVVKRNFNDRKILLSNDGPSKQLFYILRILSMTTSEYSIFHSSNKHYYKKTISYKNELKSVKLLLTLILDLKKRFYPINKLHTVKNITNTLKNKKLSYEESIVNSICEIITKEYYIIEDSLDWVNNRLSKLINSI